MDTDRGIISKIRKGDTRALATLIDRHKDRAMTLAMRMLKNRESAEEAVQDAFLRMYAALDRFEERSTFSTWFYRIVYNVCSSSLTRQRGEPPLSLDSRFEEFGEEMADETPDPLTILDQKEFAHAVHEEIANLPSTYSAITTLFLLHELSYDEIVEVTGMPLGTVKTKLFRARTLLRNQLKKKYPLVVAQIRSKVQP